MKSECSIIVSSCDFFKDCWEPFVYSVKKYWPDNEMPIFIVSNHEDYPCDVAEFIKVGDDKGWASNLKKALEQVDTNYALYLQEDYWLVESVDNEKILSQIDYCVKENLDMLRLSYPYYDQYKKDDVHAFSPIGKEKYALCLQPAIWKKSVLMKALVDGWSGWDYEANVCNHFIKLGVELKSEVVLSSSDKGYKLHYVGGTGVRKGRWTIDAARFLRENGFEKWVGKRDIEGIWMYRIIQLRKNSLFKYPATAIIRLMNKFKLNF